MAAPKILIVDDEASLLDMVGVLLEQDGYSTAAADSLSAAQEFLENDTFQLVICDLQLGDGHGFDLLRQLREDQRKVPVIVMTAYTSTDSAIEAMKLGAEDYVSKPFDIDEFRSVVRNVLDRQISLVGRRVDTRSSIVGQSPAMATVFDLITRVAKSSSTVLIQGESGTGKELVAREVHRLSANSEGPFLSINCGALPEGLLESEMFGHVRGAFTGAVQERRGLFREAGRGTLFLDEIGDMTQAMQVKLLRALQERTVRRVGGNREEPFHARIITATNQDLAGKVADSSFREDLYYRVNVLPIQVPPLRQRRDDIEVLSRHFLAKLAASGGAAEINIQALDRLKQYDWPGNVRELENAIERAATMAKTKVITLEDLPTEIRAPEETFFSGDLTLPVDGLDLENYVDSVRRELMRQALENSGGVQTKAAELLGVSFRSFRYYAKKLGLAS